MAPVNTARHMLRKSLRDPSKNYSTYKDFAFGRNSLAIAQIVNILVPVGATYRRS